MVSNPDLDALAARIRNGIARRGTHLLFPDGLALIFNRRKIKSDQEKLMLIESFASRYDMAVHVSNSFNMAVFKPLKMAARAA